MKIDENLVSISASSIPILGELKMGDDVILNIKGTIIKIEDSDNQDGTINRKYKIKGIIGEAFNNGDIINNNSIEEEVIY